MDALRSDIGQGNGHHRTNPILVIYRSLNAQLATMVVPTNFNPVSVMELYWRSLVGENVSFSRFLSVLTFFKAAPFA
jgi:hypothetical protein